MIDHLKKAEDLFAAIAFADVAEFISACTISSTTTLQCPSPNATAGVSP